MKNLDNKGFGLVEGLLLLVLVVILGAVGWYVYDVQKDNKNKSSPGQTSELAKQEESQPDTPSVEFLNNEVKKIEEVVGPSCSEEMREANKRNWVIASSEFEYYTEGQESDYQKSNKVSGDYKFANIAYGCGSQGSKFVVKKADDTWKIIAQSATVWSDCEDLTGHDVPVEIMPQCYDTDNGLQVRQ
jgi:hypothetical protein